MNIYLVKRTDFIKYDQFSGMVIIANSDDDAISVHPDGFDNCVFSDYEYHDWARSKDDLEVILLGKADKSFIQKEVILTDYRPG